MTKSKKACIGDLGFGIYLVVLVLLGFGISPARNIALAEDDMVQTQGGLRFAVPDDWPIENKAGHIVPVPVEEYVTMKFDKVDAELASIRSAVAEVLDKVQTMLDEETRQSDEAMKPIYEEFDSVKFQIETLSSDIDRLRNTVKDVGEKTDFVDKRTSQQVPSLEYRLDELQKRTRSLELYLDKIWLDLRER